MVKSVHKRLISATLVAVLSMSLVACGDTRVAKREDNLTNNVKTVSVEHKELDEAFVNTTADFTVNLFKESSKSDLETGGNVLISPQSIITAMSIATNGAAGETLNQLQNTMYGGMDIGEYNKYMKEYSGRLTSDKKVNFYLANSLWINDGAGVEIKDEYLQICKSYYDAEVYEELFDENTKSEMNTWVSDSTNGMIDGAINNLPKDATLYILNATAFEGEWDEKYRDDDIREGSTFTNSAGINQSVNMLYSEESIYLQDDMATGFVKYYKGGNYAFMAMLPNSEITVEQYVDNLTGEKLINTYNNRQNLDVTVGIPEFSYDYERDMIQDFKNLGVIDAFEAEKADFTAMDNSKTGNTYINVFLHKTYIELDRNGTKAAAITLVGNEKGEDVVAGYVILDRPFFYAIIDCKTGLPVFMGVVNSIN